MENFFENTGKTVRRVAEGLEDANQLLLNSIWDCSPGVFVEKDRIARRHSDAIKDQINMSLFHGDMDEAAYQMRRELYFCSTVDGLAGSGNELGARVGLKAIEKGLPPLGVKAEMLNANEDPKTDGYYSREPGLVEKQLQMYQDLYENDPADYCHKRVNLRNRILKATQKNEAIAPQDRCKLAMYDLAFAYLRAKAGDADKVKHVYVEAVEMLKAAKKAGVNTTQLERAANHVGWHFSAEPKKLPQ